MYPELNLAPFFNLLESVTMNEQTMRDKFESNELTWADLLEITGLPAHVLYDILQDLI